MEKNPDLFYFEKSEFARTFLLQAFLLFFSPFLDLFRFFAILIYLRDGAVRRIFRAVGSLATKNSLKTVIFKLKYRKTKTKGTQSSRRQFELRFNSGSLDMHFHWIIDDENYS